MGPRFSPAAPVWNEPGTFSEYVLQQMERGLGTGAPLHPSVGKCVPIWIARMKECQRRRDELRASRNVRIPAVLFMAITGACNRTCRHCYTRQYAGGHMRVELARRIVHQAADLGVAMLVVSGGEPLLHREFFRIPHERQEIPFLIFTNGSLLPTFLEESNVAPNMLWLVSIDGPREWNDPRRGPGSFDDAYAAMEALRRRDLPFGFSITISHDNIAQATSPEFVRTLIARGCRSGFFLEQIPSPPAATPLGEAIATRLDLCRTTLGIPIVGFPADEIRFGGCQAGGHGIAHISPDGCVEPCPAARLAVDCLEDVSLADAFANPFFSDFRNLKEALGKPGDSCAYAHNIQRFEEILFRKGARSTTRLPGTASVNAAK